MVSTLTEFATKLRSEKVLPLVQTEGTLREVHDVITEMMKQLANEPSVGLYFVQQHVHKAVPGMVSLKAQMVDHTQEVEYVTQDVKDALNSVRSMKEVGPPVIERMIKTLDSSLPRLASLRSSKRVFSAQVPLEKDISGQSSSTGDFSGYVRTTFDSAFQKATSMAWNSSSKGANIESKSTGSGEDLHVNIKSETLTESNPSLNVQNTLGTAYSSPSTLENIVPGPSTRISTSEEKLPTAQDGQVVHDSSDPSLGKSQSLPAVREVSDFGKPGQYVRAVFGSARQTAENVGREATRFLSVDGKKPASALEKPADSWGWFQVPSKAFRAFSMQSQTPEVQEGSSEKTTLDEASLSSRSEVEIEQLFEMERASNEAFVAEKAVKLEEWLQDTEEGDKMTE